MIHNGRRSFSTYYDSQSGKAITVGGQVQYHDLSHLENEEEITAVLSKYTPTSVIVPPGLLSAAKSGNIQALMHAHKIEDMEDARGSFDGVVLKASTGDSLPQSKSILAEAKARNVGADLSILTLLSCDLSAGMSMIETSSVVADLCDGYV